MIEQLALIRFDQKTPILEHNGRNAHISMIDHGDVRGRLFVEFNVDEAVRDFFAVQSSAWSVGSRRTTSFRIL